MKNIIELIIRIIIYLSIVYIYTNAGTKMKLVDMLTLFALFVIVVGIKLLGFYKKKVQQNYIRAKVMSNTFTLIAIVLVSYLNTSFSEKNISVVVISLILLAIISTFDIVRYKKMQIVGEK